MKNYSQEDIFFYKKMNKLTLVLVLLIGVVIGVYLSPKVKNPCGHGKVYVDKDCWLVLVASSFDELKLEPKSEDYVHLKMYGGPHPQEQLKPNKAYNCPKDSTDFLDCIEKLEKGL